MAACFRPKGLLPLCWTSCCLFIPDLPTAWEGQALFRLLTFQVHGHQTALGRAPSTPHGRPAWETCSDRPHLIPGPTNPRWSTPSAVWGYSSTCRRRRKRHMPGCRRGRSTTSSSRTSWWISTSRCEGSGRVRAVTQPPAHSPLSRRVPGAHATSRRPRPPASSVTI